MGKAGKAIAAIFVVIIIILMSYFYFFTGNDEIKVTPAPEYSFYETQDFVDSPQPTELSLADYKGSVLMLIINDILDPNATRQDDVTARLVDEYPNVEFINIDSHGEQKTPDTINVYKSNNNYNWTFTFDDGSFAEAYDIISLPTIVIIDTEGWGTYRSEEITDYPELSAELDRTIAGTAKRINVGKLPGIKKAPNFEVKDTDGNTRTLEDYRGKVLLLDFMSLSCVSCKQVEVILKDVVGDYKKDEFAILSIDILSSDSNDALRDHWEDEGLLWPVARDTDKVKLKYQVEEISYLVLIDKKGYLVYEYEGVPKKSDLKNEIESAIEGQSTAFSVEQTPIYVLAIVGGIVTFFSPCSFPMLPGYIAFYLQKDLAIVAETAKQGTETENSKEKRKKKAIRRAFGSGTVTAVGIVIVFTIIGLITLMATSAINEFLPVLQPIIGVLLVLLGILMFTNLQYNKIIRPFQNVYRSMSEKRAKARDTGNDTDTADVSGDKSSKKFYTGLFTYGLGYGAAAAACTFPVFLSTILGAIALPNILASALVIFLYIISMVILMISVTVAIAWLGQSAAQKLSAYTGHIKKIGAVVLILVGLWFIQEYIHIFLF